MFGLHRTVARAHLERLSELGLVESGTRRRAGGGRPAKTYVLTAERLEVVLPPRRYERLSRLLLQVIGSSLERAVAGQTAFALGRAFGADTAARIAGDKVKPPVSLAPKAVAAWMDEAGYGVSSRARRTTKSSSSCTTASTASSPRSTPTSSAGSTGARSAACSAWTSRRTRRRHQLSRGDGMCRHEFLL